jgi:hypothetical protein
MYLIQNEVVCIYLDLSRVEFVPLTIYIVDPEDVCPILLAPCNGRKATAHASGWGPHCTQCLDDRSVKV